MSRFAFANRKKRQKFTLTRSRSRLRIDVCDVSIKFLSLTQISAYPIINSIIGTTEERKEKAKRREREKTTTALEWESEASKIEGRKKLGSRAPGPLHEKIICLMPKIIYFNSSRGSWSLRGIRERVLVLQPLEFLSPRCGEIIRWTQTRLTSNSDDILSSANRFHPITSPARQ